MAASKIMAYLARESFVHSLTGTTKMLFFFLFTLAGMLTFDTRVLAGLLVVSLCAFALGNIKFRDVSVVFYFFLGFLLLNNLFVFLFSPEQGVQIYGTRHVILPLFGRYALTQEQLFYMLNNTLKYFITLPVALLFISCTNPSEFAASLASIGVSYRIGYAVAIALRYIPDIQRDFHSISQAQQARGIELGKKEKLLTRLKNSTAILFPLLLSSLARIDTIANAMELRGFGKSKKRTWYMQRRFAPRDWAVLCFAVLLLAASIVITFYDGNRFYNPFVS